MWSFSKVMCIVSGEFSWSTSISCSWSIHVNLDIRWFNIHGNISPLFDIKWFHLESSSCIHSLFHLTFSLFWPININILKINCIACIIVFTIDISCCLGVSSEHHTWGTWYSWLIIYSSWRATHSKITLCCIVSWSWSLI